MFPPQTFQIKTTYYKNTKKFKNQQKSAHAKYENNPHILYFPHVGLYYRRHVQLCKLAVSQLLNNKINLQSHSTFTINVNNCKLKTSARRRFSSSQRQNEGPCKAKITTFRLIALSSVELSTDLTVCRMGRVSSWNCFY